MEADTCPNCGERNDSRLLEPGVEVELTCVNCGHSWTTQG